MKYRLAWLESHYWGNFEPENEANIISRDEAGFDEQHEAIIEADTDQAAIEAVANSFDFEDEAFTLYNPNGEVIATEETA